MTTKMLKINRQFLAWRKPGDPDELGRVELLSALNVHDPDPFLGRTAAEVVIPAGVTLSFLVEDATALSDQPGDSMDERARLLDQEQDECS